MERHLIRWGEGSTPGKEGKQLEKVGAIGRAAGQQHMCVEALW